ncbi:hypothetical protein QS257_06535 [Terrilactibacillus sp. S3-3]|nr:hypothetical protein QS257_06535 [Terrilactibacillus sp. S3-3]
MPGHKLPKAADQALLTNRRFIITGSTPGTEGTLTFSMEGTVDNDHTIVCDCSKWCGSVQVSRGGG